VPAQRDSVGREVRACAQEPVLDARRHFTLGERALFAQALLNRAIEDPAVAPLARQIASRATACAEREEPVDELLRGDDLRHGAPPESVAICDRVSRTPAESPSWAWARSSRPSVARFVGSSRRDCTKCERALSIRPWARSVRPSSASFHGSGAPRAL